MRHGVRGSKFEVRSSSVCVLPGLKGLRKGCLWRAETPAVMGFLLILVGALKVD